MYERVLDTPLVKLNFFFCAGTEEEKIDLIDDLINYRNNGSHMFFKMGS